MATSPDLPLQPHGQDRSLQRVYFEAVSVEANLEPPEWLTVPSLETEAKEFLKHPLRFLQLQQPAAPLSLFQGAVLGLVLGQAGVWGSGAVQILRHREVTSQGLTQLFHLPYKEKQENGSFISCFLLYTGNYDVA